MSDLIDLHILIEEDIKAELKVYYPGHGELSALFRNIAELVLIQLREGVTVNPETTAKAVVADERKRGRRGGA